VYTKLIRKGVKANKMGALKRTEINNFVIRCPTWWKDSQITMKNTQAMYQKSADNTVTYDCSSGDGYRSFRETYGLHL
jgi:hypothetical protein